MEMSTTNGLEENHKTQHSGASMESLYSSGSLKSAAGRRKPQRQAGIMHGNNDVRQRVISARLLRVKNLQNQLNDAMQHIATLAAENRLLRTLHKRQDSALSKYESSNAELPQLLQSHAEEVRIWQAKYRGIHAQNRELAHKLKQKDSVLIQLSDQNKHLLQLNRDKNLEERESLAGRLKHLETRLIEKEEEINMLQRKNRLEAKNMKAQLIKEQSKYRELCEKFEKFVTDSSRKTSNSNSYEALQNKILGSMLPKSIHVRGQPRLPSRLTYNGNSKNISSVLPLMKSSSATMKSEQMLKSPSDVGDDRLTGFDQHGNLNNTFNVECNLKNGGNSENEDEQEDRNNDDCHTDFGTEAETCHDDEDLIVKTLIEQNPIGSGENDICENFNSLSIDALNDNLLKIRSEINGDILKNESLLDLYCDSVTKDAAIVVNIPEAPRLNAKERKIPQRASIPVATKRQTIDPSKKNKLLAALKAIDSNSSVDN